MASSSALEKPILFRTYRFVQGPMPRHLGFELPRIEQWFMIRRTEGGSVLSQVFKDSPFPIRDEICFHGTSCAIVGSQLYVIGGDTKSYGYKKSESDAIRCIDTRHPRLGWSSCDPLPFKYGYSGAYVCGSYIYLFPKLHPHVEVTCDCYWGYMYETTSGEGRLIKPRPYLSKCNPCHSIPAARDVQPMLCSPYVKEGRSCVLIVLASRKDFYIHYPEDDKWERLSSHLPLPREFEIELPHALSNGILSFGHQEDGIWFLSAYDIAHPDCQQIFKVKTPFSRDVQIDKRDLFIVLVGDYKYGLVRIERDLHSRSRNRLYFEEANILHYTCLEVSLHPTTIAKVLEQTYFVIEGRYIADCLRFDSYNEEQGVEEEPYLVKLFEKTSLRVPSITPREDVA